MADVMQNTNLLDEYLKNTVGKPSTAAKPHQLPVQQQQLAAEEALQELAIPNNLVLKKVHQALDEVLAAVTPRACTDAGQKHQNALAGALSSSSQAGSPCKAGKERSSKAGVKGIFRAMRQADAAAMYAERFQKDQDQQQQPVFIAPADGTTGAVRIIAGNAALQAKLQRLQSDMDARSYRQQLMQQLQRPDALFQPAQQQQMQLQQQIHIQQHRRRRSSASQPQEFCSSSVDACGQHVFQGLGSGPLLRPATSPALIGGASNPTAGLSCAATAASSRRSSSWNDGGADNFAAAATVTAGRTPGRPPPGLCPTSPHNLRHLRELAEYEMPWQPPGAAAGSCRGSSDEASKPSVYYSSRQHSFCGAQRFHTSAGGAAEPRGQRRSSSSGGISKKASLLGPSKPHTSSGGGAWLNQQQHQQQRQQQQVPRPASAVAALQQSLSELAMLKSKYSQQQHQAHVQHTHQHKEHMHHQHKQQQQQHSSHQSRQTDPGHTIHYHKVPDQQQQRSSTWLPQQHWQHWDSMPDAAADFSNDPCSGRLGVKAAADGSGYLGGVAAAAAGLTSGSRRQSSATLGFGIWDSWQQQVHGSAAAAAEAATAAAWDGCGLHSSVLHAQHQRAKSAPRPLRAWDAMPPAAAATTRRSRKTGSSPGMLSGRLQQRPQTAGGFEGMSQQHRVSLRPLASQHTTNTVRSQAGPAAAASMAGTGARYSSNGTSNTWLASSPLQRAQQQLAANGMFRQSSGGGTGGASQGGAASRAKAVAAVLAGVQRPMASTAGAMHSMGAAAAAGGLEASRRVSSTRSSSGGLAATHALATAGSPTKLPGSFGSSRLSQLRAASGGGGYSSGGFCSAPASPAKPGRAAAAAQLLQKLRDEQQAAAAAAAQTAPSGCKGARHNATVVYADRLASAVGRLRGPSSGGGGGAAAFGGAVSAGGAPLTQQIMEYAAYRYKSPHARRRKSDCSSSSSSSSSEASDSSASEAASAPRDTQSAYAAALNRVRAASRAAREAKRRGGSDNDNDSD